MASWKAQEYVIWASVLQREECTVDELYVSIKCGESDTTSGLASNPTVGRAVERLLEAGATVSFGETTEITGAEDICKQHAATPEVGKLIIKCGKSTMISSSAKVWISWGLSPLKAILPGLTTIEEKLWATCRR